MLPVHLLIDATLKTLSERGGFYTIIQRGERSNGVIMLKLWSGGDTCKLLQQQRDLDGDMQWVNALDQDIVTENEADAYIKQSVQYDPDLWVIEIEHETMDNPFKT